MKPLRILLVSQRFWPHSGLTEQSFSDLARNLSDAGQHVEIASFQWARDWCHKIEFYGLPIHRFSRPVGGPWSSFRYTRSLARHFATHDYDAVICNGMGDDAAAVIRWAPDETPIVLHIDEGYTGVQRSIHRRHIETCLAADAVVANSWAVQRTLQRYAEMPVVRRIEPGLRSDLSHCSKSNMRSALAGVHEMLRLEPKHKLVVTSPRLNQGCGVFELIRIWPAVARAVPHVKLWIIGDGPVGSEIWQQIVNLDLSSQVIMPGLFDRIEDLFPAADLYVQPASESQSGDGMIKAIHYGLPVVAVENKYITELEATFATGINAVPLPKMADHIIENLTSKNANDQNGDLPEVVLPRNYLPATQARQFLSLIHQLAQQPVGFAS